MIKSIVVAYAILRGHNKVAADEYRFLDMLEPCIRNPFESIKLKILELAHTRRSVRDICRMLNKDYDSYRPYVSRVIGEYRKKGVLSSMTHRE